MKTIEGTPPLSCDNCRCHGIPVIYDTPALGVWGNICPTCLVKEPARGTRIVDNSWDQCWPELKELITQAREYCSSVGLQYSSDFTLDRCFQEHGEEGIAAQIPYIRANMDREVAGLKDWRPA